MNQAEVKVVGLSFRHTKEQFAIGDRVKLVPEPDNKYDPNALSVQTMDGHIIGYVGKADKLRTKMLRAAQSAEVTLPVLVANYYTEGDDRLWDDVEEGDLVQLWLRAYSKTPLEDDTFVEVESFTGETVLWSEYKHICVDQKGNELMGGSTYASQFQKDFDSSAIADRYAKKNGHTKQDILDFWESLKDISTDYGTSVHTAMEQYAKFHKSMGDQAMPRIPHLKAAVEDFLTKSDFDNCIAEPLITDVKMGMSGWVDLLRFTGDKKVIIEDYKTNTFKDDKSYHSKWKPKLEYYSHQMNYYGTILENFGYTIEGIVVWHWYRDKWTRYELEYKPIKQYRREA